MRQLRTKLFAAGMTVAALAACGSMADTQMTVSGLNPNDFDSTVMGKKTELITLKNNNGMEVCLTNYGGRVVSISVPDKNGKPTDVVLGYDNIHQYADTLNSPSDYGSSVGRYANRIKDAKLTVAGKTYNLRANDNGNCLHGGGNTGWLNKVYDVQSKTDSSVVFAITSPDGDNGFPGTVKATATYTVKSNNTLDIVFQATTDKETVVNMTNHLISTSMATRPRKARIRSYISMLISSPPPTNTIFLLARFAPLPARPWISARRTPCQSISTTSPTTR